MVLVVANQDSLPCALEKLQFYSGWLIGSAFGFGGDLFASVSDASGDHANQGNGVSKFHGLKCQGAGRVECKGFVNCPFL